MSFFNFEYIGCVVLVFSLTDFEHVNAEWNTLLPYSEFVYAFQSRIWKP